MEEDIELIHRYILKKCTKEEIEDIQRRLNVDTDFVEIYEKEKSLIQGIALSERDALKATLNSLNIGKKPSPKYWYAVAALIPLMIISYVLISIRPDSTELYDQYYERYGLYEFGYERGSTDSLLNIDEVFKFYAQGNYSAAIEGLDSLILKDDTQVAFIFYRGICYLELANFEAAKTDMRSVIDSNSSYSPNGMWYLALAHLGQNDKEKCKEILRELIEQENGWGNKARELIEDLK